jgi:hypothetical protein
LDAEPVRIIEERDVIGLAEALEKVLAEDQPTVPSPDWNDAGFSVGIRAPAVGVKSWRAFVKHARAFNVEELNDGLLLEEWPREGYSFAAKPLWRKKFAHGAFGVLARFLVDSTLKPSPG